MSDGTARVESRYADEGSSFDSALLDALEHEGSLAFAVFDAESRYVRVSDAMAALHAVPVERHLGRRPSEVLGGAAGRGIEARVRDVLASVPGPAEPDELVDRSDRSGRRRYLARWLPVRTEAGEEIVGAAELVIGPDGRRTPPSRSGDASWRGAGLERVTAQLAGALSIAEVRAMIARLGEAIAAAHAEVRLLDDGPGHPGWRAVTRDGVPAQRGRTRAPFDGWPEPLVAAVRTGRPQYVMDRGELARRFPTAAVGDRRERAWVALPITGSRGLIGGLYVTYTEPRLFDDDDRSLLDTVAAQCALAVERARLHDREHGQVVMLQRALLPDRLPWVPGGRVAFRYLSGTPDVAVGGDWYDAFAFPDGRFGVVVGDVIGKGIGAAAGMARMRTALRALAFSDARPRGVIAGLDRLFEATEPDESLTTVVYAVLDPARRRMVLADAGHLPLLLVSADGTARYEDAGVPASTPLGCAEERTDREIELAAGDIVIAFSDGLVENRRRSLGAGLDELRAVAAGPHHGLEDLLDRVLRQMFAGYERDDDVTLLAAALW